MDAKELVSCLESGIPCLRNQCTHYIPGVRMLWFSSARTALLACRIICRPATPIPRTWAWKQGSRSRWVLVTVLFASCLFPAGCSSNTFDALSAINDTIVKIHQDPEAVTKFLSDLEHQLLANASNSIKDLVTAVSDLATRSAVTAAAGGMCSVQYVEENSVVALEEIEHDFFHELAPTRVTSVCLGQPNPVDEQSVLKGDTKSVLFYGYALDVPKDLSADIKESDGTRKKVPAELVSRTSPYFATVILDTTSGRPLVDSQSVGAILVADGKDISTVGITPPVRDELIHLTITFTSSSYSLLPVIGNFAITTVSILGLQPITITGVPVTENLPNLLAAQASASDISGRALQICWMPVDASLAFTQIRWDFSYNLTAERPSGKQYIVTGSGTAYAIPPARSPDGCYTSTPLP